MGGGGEENLPDGRANIMVKMILYKSTNYAWFAHSCILQV